MFPSADGRANGIGPQPARQLWTGPESRASHSARAAVTVDGGASGQAGEDSRDGRVARRGRSGTKASMGWPRRVIDLCCTRSVISPTTVVLAGVAQDIGEPGGWAMSSSNCEGYKPISFTVLVMRDPAAKCIDEAARSHGESPLPWKEPGMAVERWRSRPPDGVSALYSMIASRCASSRRRTT